MSGAFAIKVKQSVNASKSNNLVIGDFPHTPQNIKTVKDTKKFPTMPMPMITPNAKLKKISIELAL